MEKKLIGRDWAARLTGFGQLKWNSFYRIIGPIVIGIELKQIRSEEEYRPVFVVCSLWANADANLRSCLTQPFITRSITKWDLTEYTITYENHSVFFEEALADSLRQIPFPIEGNVSLADLKQFVNGYQRFDSPENIGDQLSLLEILLFCALYVGQEVEAKKILTDSKDLASKWNKRYPEFFPHSSLVAWVNSLLVVVKDFDRFIDVVNRRKHDQLIATIPFSELYL